MPAKNMIIHNAKLTSVSTDGTIIITQHDGRTVVARAQNKRIDAAVWRFTGHTGTMTLRPAKTGVRARLLKIEILITVE